MPSTARRETGFVAAMTFVGAVLRFWGPGRLGLNHFDEGIYALAATWSSAPKGLASITPELIAYAPPLYPILVGVVYLFLGVSDISAILVSQIAGTLTIPAVAWVARRTFGPGAGAAAAALVAISGPHIAFSRMALTDATFLLCWVLAIGLAGRFLERPGLLRAIAFGLMVGLAQNAKYNGYLVGGIVALAAVWGLILSSGDGFRVMGYGVVAAAVAALVYLPWYRFVESHPGGYAGLMKHHRSYLSGPSAWPIHWRLQMGQSYALSGELIERLTWGIVTWPVAWIGGTLASGVVNRPRRAQMRMRLGFMLGAAVYGVAPNAGWWVALAMMPWWLISESPAKRVLGVGWLVMAVLTPFYHPYARLWLPLHAFGWMALAGLVLDDQIVRRLRTAGLASAIVAAVLVDAVVEPQARSLGSPIGPTDELRAEVGNLAAHVKAQRKLDPTLQRILLLARPTVLFYLAPQSDLPIARLSDLPILLDSARPGDGMVLDEVVSGDILIVINRFHAMREGNLALDRPVEFTHLLPPATWADHEPSAVFDHRAQGYGLMGYTGVRAPSPRVLHRGRVTP